MAYRGPQLPLRLEVLERKNMREVWQAALTVGNGGVSSGISMLPFAAVADTGRQEDAFFFVPGALPPRAYARGALWQYVYARVCALRPETRVACIFWTGKRIDR